MTLSVFSALSTSVPVAKAQGDVSVFLRPGVPDPYNPGFSHTLGTLVRNPELVLAQYMDYAILTGSVGDFQFDVVVNNPIYTLRIYVPGEFSFTKDMTYSVWTDITNDYGFVLTSDRGSTDDTAPNWHRITIGIHDTLAPTVVIEPGLYHVRLFALKAPEVFGVYHMKIFVDTDGTGPVSIAVEDYPIIIVKGELNPAYIIGKVTAETGVWGKVTASGTTSDGRSVSGLFYFSPLFEDPATPGDYNYYLLGAPAGSYEITASAANDAIVGAVGYVPKTSSRFTVAAGQSVHGIDISLDASPQMAFTVWSKHGRGAIPWNCLWQPPYGTNYIPDLNDPAEPCLTDTAQWRSLYVHLLDDAGNDVGTVFGPEALDPLAVSYTTPMTSWPIELAGVPDSASHYVSGLATGKTYTVQAYVTGYVMADVDAAQRTFTVSGDSITVEMDLRRSNWFEIQAHTITPNNDMTLAYTAVGSDGKVHGLAVYRVPYGTDAPAIILEGWNSATDSWTDTVPAPDPLNRDYGLDPGTYSIKLYAADGTPPDPVVAGGVEGTGWYYIKADQPYSSSIALCNSPSTLSFDVGSISLTFTLRSVDWEAPAHLRPWTFPGAEIWVDFLDSSGVATGESIDPTVWGLVQDDYYPGGAPIIGSPYLDPLTVTGESTHTLTITWTGNDVTDPADVLDNTLPTHLESGQYSFAVNTFGYATRRLFPAWVPTGGNGDIQADLVQGGEIRVNVHFTKEAQDVDFNGFVRVEVFDKDNKLVGANIYGQAQPYQGTTLTGDGLSTGSYYDYDTARDYMLVTGPAEGSNADPYGQRGYTSMSFYGQPSATWANWAAMDPSDANRLNLPGGEKQAYDVFGFYWYYGGACSRNEGLWANGWVTTDGVKQNDHGIKGSSDIADLSPMGGAGPYTVKVYAFDSQGDLNSYYTDPVTNVNVGWGQAQEITVELKQMGRISGTIMWFDMYGNMKNMPWASLSTGEEATYSTSPVPADWGFGYTDQAYYLWVPAGTHDLSVAVNGPSQAFASAGSTVAVSDGFNTSYDEKLYPTGVPVPEFPASMLLVMLSALGASVYLLRRRRNPT